MDNKKNYKKKTFEEKKKEVDTLIKGAEEKLDSYFISEESIKEYLNFMSNFYNYSLHNTMLIDNQFDGARAVGSYKFWNDKGFQIKKGEKGIKILVPMKTKPRFERDKGEWIEVDEATPKEKKKINNGEITVNSSTYFTVGNVFDISQTTAKASDLPTIFPNKWLEGDVENYKFLYRGIEEVAKSIGVKIIEPKDELGVVKGASYPLSREVTINPRNGELQNIKTLFHELTHAKLHTIDTRDKYTSSEKEFQAEMTAYTICSYFGLDTSDYSLNYIHNWTKGKELKDKQQLLKEVRETSISYIDTIETSIIKEIQNELIDYKDLNYSSANEAIKIYNSLKKEESKSINCSIENEINSIHAPDISIGVEKESDNEFTFTNCKTKTYYDNLFNKIVTGKNLIEREDELEL